MFRIAICDDNKYDINAISSVLEELRSEGLEYEIYTFISGPELIKSVEYGKRYHLLILDMVMEPINGIETAKRLRQFDVAMPILIVTATTEYALDGYQVDAWRYLTKPIDRERFLNEVRSIMSHSSRHNTAFFVVSNDNGVTKIRVDDILYFDSNLHTITVHTLNEKISFRDTIAAVEERVEGNGFFRIHKSFIVNLNYVQSVSKNIVTLVNGEQLDLSKKRAAEFHKALLDNAAEKRNAFSRF